MDSFEIWEAELNKLAYIEKGIKNMPSKEQLEAIEISDKEKKEKRYTDAKKIAKELNKHKPKMYWSNRMKKHIPESEFLLEEEWEVARGFNNK